MHRRRVLLWLLPACVLPVAAIAFFWVGSIYDLSGRRDALMTAVLWLFLATFALLPAAMVLLTWTFSQRTRRLREHRRVAGRCAECDYDLTGNESGVCPECGCASAAANVYR